MMPLFPESCSSRLPDGTVARLDAAAAVLGISRSAVARTAILRLLGDLARTATITKSSRRNGR